MKNKNAMTLVEILLTLVILGVVLSVSTVAIKITKDNKDIYKIRATLYNIQKINEILLTKKREQGEWSLDDNINTVCSEFTDTINTKGNPNCTGGSFTMANGIEISGFNGSWSNPSGEIKHYYKDITFDINGNKSPNEIGKDRFIARIFKDEPIVIPLTLNLLNDGNKVRYKVAQIREHVNNTYMSTYKIINNNNKTSYGEAACLTGIADEFMTSGEKGTITTCPSVDVRCLRYFDCQAQILDIPASVISFKGR